MTPKLPPESGGVFVLMAIAARKAGRPVKWVEERIEHLIAATSATNRVTTLSAAVGDDGVVTALDWDQLEDCGAYLRAPEPATLYCDGSGCLNSVGPSVLRCDEANLQFAITTAGARP